MKRHRDALGIQAGACNPSGIALSIVDACREFRDNPKPPGVATITEDPAIRLMVHQLAYICGVGDSMSLTDYGDCMNACREQANPVGWEKAETSNEEARA